MKQIKQTNKRDKPINERLKTSRPLNILKCSGLLFLLFTFCSLNSQGAISKYVLSPLKIKKKKAPLKEVLTDIKEKIGYTFFYSDDVEKQYNKMGIDVSADNINDLLNKVFSGTNIIYEIKETNVILKLKPKTTSGVEETEMPKNETQEIDGQEKELADIDSNKIQVLDEVVALGYGGMQKKSLTSAISSIKAEVFAERPIVDVGQAMQGNAAGVSVVQPSGKPGGGMEIKIRGVNSINSGTSPLFVVDGVQTYDVSGLNPNDIVDMNILKDATSTAIYGISGSAGVVIITTKRAKVGDKGKFDFNMYFGLSQVSKVYKMLDADGYKDLMKDIIYAYYELADMPIYKGINTNWAKEVFKLGLDQNYTLSYAKSFSKVSTVASFGYQNTKGVIHPSDFNRFSGRLNLDVDIIKNIKFNTSLNYIFSSTNNILDNVAASRGGVVSAVFYTQPYLPVYAEQLGEGRDTKANGQQDGQFAINPLSASRENPVAYASPLNQTIKHRILSSFGLDITLLKNLVWKPNITYDVEISIQDRFADNWRTEYGRSANRNPQQPRNIPAPGNNPTGSNNLDTRVNAWRNNLQVLNYNFENTLGYTIKDDINNFNILVGNSIQERDYQSISIVGSGFTQSTADNIITKLDFNDAKFTARGLYKSIVRYVSFFGRVNYTYNDKYSLSAVFRSTGASQLAPGNKWGFNPGVSGAWIISNEDFLKDNQMITQLKLRGGWGRTGNVTGIHSYAWAATERPSVDTPQRLLIYAQNQYENKDLTWETTDDANIGLDLEILKKYTLNIDVYQRKTKNLLMPVFFPFNPTLAYQANAGDLTNKGFDLTLSTINIKTKNFSWSTNIVYSMYKNNVDELKYVNEYLIGFFERTAEYGARLIPGQPIGVLWGFKYKRDFESTKGVNPQTGYIEYEDLNGDGSWDRTAIGNPHPDFTFGFTNDFKYKNFYLNIFINGSVGNDILNASKLDLESLLDYRNQLADVNERRWKKPGDLTSLQKTGDFAGVVMFDRYIEDGSYARIKALTIGYQFKGMIKYIANLNIYFTTQNLYTLTNYTGMDPEVNAYSGNNQPTFGIDYGTYPQVKTFIIGLKANLQ